MWRYLKEAFWLRVPLPLLGALPVNALGVFGVGVLGFAEHAVWLLGAGAEAAYLFFLVTNPRFQNVISARDFQRVQAGAAQSHHELVEQLPPEARARLERLEGRVARIAALYRANDENNLLGESSLDALQKLAALYARLLLAERHLQAARHETDEPALARRVAGLERELATGAVPLSPSLRESKQATLALLQKRLANAGERDRQLAEIGSDLARVEAQVDLALEDAGIQGSRPPAAAGHLNLFNQILESNLILGGDLEAPLATEVAPGPARRVAPPTPEAY